MSPRSVPKNRYDTKETGQRTSQILLITVLVLLPARAKNTPAHNTKNPAAMKNACQMYMTGFLRFMRSMNSKGEVFITDEGISNPVRMAMNRPLVIKMSLSCLEYSGSFTAGVLMNLFMRLHAKGRSKSNPMTVSLSLRDAKGVS